MTPAPPKPLSYLCHGPVLVHMDAYCRTRFSLCCPGIRFSEKLAPLKVRTLAINPLSLQLGNTILELGVVPKKHITTSVDHERLLSDEKVLEKKLEEIGIYMRPEFNSYEMQHYSHLEDYQKLLDVRTRLNSTCYIQVSEKSSKFYKIQYLEYNHSIRSTMEHLIKQLFGGRKTVNVKSMPLGFANTAMHQPPGFEVEQLAQQILNVLQSNFHFSIRCLTSETENLDFNNPMLQYTNKVTVFGEPLEYLGDLRKVPKVHFSCYSYKILRVPRLWLQEKHPDIGTQWSCDFEDRSKSRVSRALDAFFDNLKISEYPGLKCLNRSEDGYDGLPMLTSRIICPINETSEVHIFCDRNSTSTKTSTLVMEVFPLGSSKKLAY